MSINEKLELLRPHAKVSAQKFIIALTFAYKHPTKQKYEVSIVRGSDGDSVLICTTKDFDTAKEQCRFYSEWFDCPMQFALPDTT